MTAYFKRYDKNGKQSAGDKINDEIRNIHNIISNLC